MYHCSGSKCIALQESWRKKLEWFAGLGIVNHCSAKMHCSELPPSQHCYNVALLKHCTGLIFTAQHCQAMICIGNTSQDKTVDCIVVLHWQQTMMICTRLHRYIALCWLQCISGEWSAAKKLDLSIHEPPTSCLLQMLIMMMILMVTAMMMIGSLWRRDWARLANPLFKDKTEISVLKQKKIHSGPFKHTACFLLHHLFCHSKTSPD